MGSVGPEASWQPIKEPGERTGLGLEELLGGADPVLLAQLAADLAAITDAEARAYQETRHIRLGAFPSGQMVEVV